MKWCTCTGVVSVGHQLALRLEEGASTLDSAQLEPADTDIDDLVDACRGGQQRMDVLVRRDAETPLSVHYLRALTPGILGETPRCDL